MKTIKKYFKGGVNPHEPLTEEEKEYIKNIFDGDVEAYLRSKEMTRVLKEYEYDQRMKKEKEYEKSLFNKQQIVE